MTVPEMVRLTISRADAELLLAITTDGPIIWDEETGAWRHVDADHLSDAIRAALAAPEPSVRAGASAGLDATITDAMVERVSELLAHDQVCGFAGSMGGGERNYRNNDHFRSLARQVLEAAMTQARGAGEAGRETK